MLSDDYLHSSIPLKGLHIKAIDGKGAFGCYEDRSGSFSVFLYKNLISHSLKVEPASPPAWRGSFKT